MLTPELGVIPFNANTQNSTDDLHNFDEERTDELRVMRLFRVSAVGVAVLDQDGIFTAVNKAFFTATGYTKRQLLMKPFNTAFSDANDAQNMRLWRRLPLKRYPDCHIERRIARKNGSTAAVRIALMTLDAVAGRRPHYLAMIENLVEEDGCHSKPAMEKRGISSIAAQLIQYQEDERRRLARELHDGIGQSMSLITAEIALMASQYAGIYPTIGGRLATLREQLDQVCSDLHCMSHNLHSYKLQHLGLESALKDLCRQLSCTELQVDLNIGHGAVPNSSAVSLCLYRIAQEALRNCVKHSHTRFIALTLVKLQKTFRMTVKDSGIGFNPSVISNGLGLVSMKERLALVNGRMKVISKIGLGTEICVLVPQEVDMAATEDRDLKESLGEPAMNSGGAVRQLAMVRRA